MKIEKRAQIKGAQKQKRGLSDSFLFLPLYNIIFYMPKIYMHKKSHGMYLVSKCVCVSLLLLLLLLCSLNIIL